MSLTTSARALPPQSPSSTINLSPRPRSRSLKKPVSPLHVDIPAFPSTVARSHSFESSPLTPLSSPIEWRAVQELPLSSLEKPPIASSSGSKKSVQAKRPRKLELKSDLRDTWDLRNLGPHVWVLLERRALALELADLKDTKSQKTERIWWPGKITSAKIDALPLRVSLANASGFGVSKGIEIIEPCQNNIISWEDASGSIRFKEPTFINVTSIDRILASPRKKQKAHRQGKYEVEFLDGKIQAIPRSWFFVAEDDGFGTCMLGKWESAFQEVQNDDDDDDDDGNQQDSKRQRSPSPIPTIPPPSREAFNLLEIRQQLAYAKPILLAILRESFPPAMRRHKNFLAGGSKKKNVVDEASLRGQMNPLHVNALQRYISDWCLRDEQRAQVIPDEEDIHAPPSIRLGDDILRSTSRAVSPTPTERTEFSEAELPPMSSFAASQGTSSVTYMNDSMSVLGRQYGCAAFEALSRAEKNDYCLNVLVPEAMLQILLWRAGERTSLDILDDADEAILYAKGLELLRASDWVNDVMRLRKTAKGQLGKSMHSH
ncbi:hypothetical protein C0991_002954 [Blastosporella zonata]|nr:hypothetical protein C0991_002954 [Blastosporella zonata]